jgi:hypothetical protein
MYTGNVVVMGIYEGGRLNGEGLIVTDFQNYIKANFHTGVPHG